MTNGKVSKITIGDVSRHVHMDSDISVMKNFVIFDKNLGLPRVAFSHPYIIDGICLLICTGGNGKIKINVREYHVQKNTIILLLPGNVIELVERSDNFAVEHLIFSFDLLSDIRIPYDPEVSQKMRDSPCIVVNDEQFDILIDFHNFIALQYKRSNNQQQYREAIIKTLLISFLIEIASIYLESEVYKPQSSNRKTEQLNQFVSLVVLHHKEERSIAFYADKMCLTPKYLAQSIKDASKKPALQWINDITILSIKAMLKSTDLTVAQISEELNFPNPSFFGRYFKKHTGLTPVEYRKN